MTPSELTDEIDKFLKEDEQLPWGTKLIFLDMASTMIKEQSKQIEDLKRRLTAYKQSCQVANTQIKALQELSDDEIIDRYRQIASRSGV